MIFDYNVIWEAMPLYFGGLLTTLKLLACRCSSACWRPSRWA
jgi:hypothetical protein